MLVNELPAWLPAVNLGISIVGFVFAIFLLLFGKKERRSTYLVFLFANLVLLAGALFQANLVGLLLWTILGTGGRAFNVLTMFIDAGKDLLNK